MDKQAAQKEFARDFLVKRSLKKFALSFLPLLLIGLGSIIVLLILAGFEGFLWALLIVFLLIGLPWILLKAQKVKEYETHAYYRCSPASAKKAALLTITRTFGFRKMIAAEDLMAPPDLMAHICGYGSSAVDDIVCITIERLDETNTCIHISGYSLVNWTDRMDLNKTIVNFVRILNAIFEYQ